MGRNMVVAIVDSEGRERQSFKPAVGARLRVDHGGKVVRGQRVADWDPYSTPIISEVAGRARYEDLVEGQTYREDYDDLTGISSRVIIDWRSSSKTASIRPGVSVVDEAGNPHRLASGAEARYSLPVGAILSVQDGEMVGPGVSVARIATGGAKTRDITGGLPRVAELFEARRPKDHAIIAELDGRIEFGKDYKNKRRLRILPDDESRQPAEYLLAKGKHITVQDGDRVRRGDFIIDGNPAPQDILAILGVEALADYLVNEIQKVYRLQGVPINDKHIEVIVRQMLQKVEIVESGDTEFIRGDQVDTEEFEEENERMRANGLKEATSQPVLLGITKASLQTRSFISAASFQETTRVLTEAAVNGKSDTLEGLKENVIVGRLIPAGTGNLNRRYRRIAAERDTKSRAIIAQAEQARQAALAEANRTAAPRPGTPVEPGPDSGPESGPESGLEPMAESGAPAE